MEPLTDREQALIIRERDIAEREKAVTEREISPRLRLLITIFAQGIGLILLFVLGVGTFPSGQENIVRGFKFIQKMGWVYLGFSVGIPLIPLLVNIFLNRRLFRHGYVDFVLLSYVGVDLIILLLLVCQEGGICRSMFLPVYFIVPTAYLIAERPKRRGRKLMVLFAVVVCIYISYRVATWFMPPQGPNLNPATGTVKFLWWSMQITDFSTLAHSHYDEAVFWASFISALIPIVQIFLVILRDIVKAQDDEEALPPTLVDGAN